VSSAERRPSPAAASAVDVLVVPLLLAGLACGAAVAALVWLAGAANTLAAAGRPPHIPLTSLPRIVVGIVERPSTPARAWPAADREDMLPGLGWYLVAAPALLAAGAVILVVALLAWRLVRRAPRDQVVAAVPWRTRTPAGRSVWLRARRGRNGRLALGAAMPGCFVAEPQVHACVVAPPGQHKTTGIVIPALLEWPGSVVCLSTKPDALAATHVARAARGRVWVWDPFGEASCSWTPLAGCAAWETALLRAEALTSAARRDRDTAAGEWWDSVAADLIAPLLHAAALGGSSIQDVVAWIAQNDGDTPRELLRRHSGTAQAAAHLQAAIDELDAVRSREDRSRSNTWLAASQLLKAYRHPAVARASQPDDLTADGLLAASTATLYVVASDEHQALLRPLVVALVQSIYAAAFARGRRAPLEPPLLFALDECANIAPLSQLPAYLAQARAAGITFLTVWQDLAQMRQRYGDAAGSILSNSLAKVFLSGSSDPATLTYLRQLLGLDRAGATQTFDPRQLDGRALVLYRDHAPFLLRPQPWYQTPRLRRLARGAAK
jgi:type IV secretory pathway TraG/TraD family ATPase VirD4